MSSLLRQRCDHGRKGKNPCRRKAALWWNAAVSPPGGRRRRLLRGSGILVCRRCAEYLTAQLDMLTLCLVARDGKRLARHLWG